MKIPARRRDVGLSFNITPLIDIVFLLVIFFLVSTHFVSSDAREAVALPTASTTSDEPPAPRRLIVTVLPNGDLIAGGRVLPLEGVEALIESDARDGTDDYEVQIRADHAVDYTIVEPLMEACVRHGVTRVKVSKLDR
jgi:biopolymer transport protein ExbD